jgi:hypothetical protein
MSAKVGAQAATDKLTLKSQVDNLSVEVEALKAKQTKAQELQRLHDEHLAMMDAREKNLQDRLHEAVEALCGKLAPTHHCNVHDPTLKPHRACYVAVAGKLDARGDAVVDDADLDSSIEAATCICQEV